VAYSFSCDACFDGRQLVAVVMPCRYADASLEKSSWPEVMKGLAWCKQQLEQACQGIGPLKRITASHGQIAMT